MRFTILTCSLLVLLWLARPAGAQTAVTIGNAAAADTNGFDHNCVIAVIPGAVANVSANTEYRVTASGAINSSAVGVIPLGKPYQYATNQVLTFFTGTTFPATTNFQFYWKTNFVSSSNLTVVTIPGPVPLNTLIQVPVPGGFPLFGVTNLIPCVWFSNAYNTIAFGFALTVVSTNLP